MIAIKHQFRRLVMALAASLPHLIAGLVTLSYNAAVHASFEQGAGSRQGVLDAALIYASVSISIGILSGARIAKRLDGTTERFLSFINHRALIGTLLWLSGIPILGTYAKLRYGSVHPIGFPHFCASVIVGWLISTTYSTLLSIYCFRRTCENGANNNIRIQKILRFLPLPAAGVALVATIMFLLFCANSIPDQSKQLLIDRYLIGLLTLGGYGSCFCYWSSQRLLR